MGGNFIFPTLCSLVVGGTTQFVLSVNCDRDMQRTTHVPLVLWIQEDIPLPTLTCTPIVAGSAMLCYRRYIKCDGLTDTVGRYPTRMRSWLNCPMLINTRLGYRWTMAGYAPFQVCQFQLTNIYWQSAYKRYIRRVHITIVAVEKL